ncbi:ADP-ribosylation factor-like protein 2-binding protein isoform X2 [Pseudomyrmex gracilis]|uniref:ADP-ribosylation factor-like protein 2-binding protein isoform X2 n=1 Tax=Pseudomyrmex gracilis TaxID=219809 RepID=UPI000995AA8F|nr:ADP-ribosylation factor-like protein 2-binding protein isoform X2 [Pseudomyrmex gracilis]
MDELNLSSLEIENQTSKSEEDYLFDKVIGHIEDLLLEGFQALQHKFLEKYWDVFEPVEDNKLIYTNIFNEYTKAVEVYIVDYLKNVMPQFTIDILLHQLKKKQAELEGEVFEVLSTITDFLAFKEMVLDYRAVKEGKIDDLSCGISVTSLKSSIENSTYQDNM